MRATQFGPDAVVEVAQPEHDIMFEDPRRRRRLDVVQRARHDRQGLELRAVADGLEVRIAASEAPAVVLETPQVLLVRNCLALRPPTRRLTLAEAVVVGVVAAAASSIVAAVTASAAADSTCKTSSSLNLGKINEKTLVFGHGWSKTI